MRRKNADVNILIDKCLNVATDLDNYQLWSKT